MGVQLWEKMKLITVPGLGFQTEQPVTHMMMPNMGVLKPFMKMDQHVLQLRLLDVQIAHLQTVLVVPLTQGAPETLVLIQVLKEMLPTVSQKTMQLIAQVLLLQTERIAKALGKVVVPVRLSKREDIVKEHAAELFMMEDVVLVTPVQQGPRPALAIPIMTILIRHLSPNIYGTVVLVGTATGGRSPAVTNLLLA